MFKYNFGPFLDENYDTGWSTSWLLWGQRWWWRWGCHGHHHWLWGTVILFTVFQWQEHVCHSDKDHTLHVQVLAGEKEQYTVYKLKLSTPSSVRFVNTSTTCRLTCCHALYENDVKKALIMIMTKWLVFVQVSSSSSSSSSSWVGSM